MQMMIGTIPHNMRMLVQFWNQSVVLVGESEAMVPRVVTGAETVIGAAAMKTQE